jgi:hypothetical protein
LALMIHDLIASFDFQYKQVKKSKKIWRLINVLKS